MYLNKYAHAYKQKDEFNEKKLRVEVNSKTVHFFFFFLLHWSWFVNRTTVRSR